MLSYSSISYLRYHQPQTVNGRDSPKTPVMLAAPLLFEFWLVSRSYAQDRGNLMSFSVVIFGGIHGVTREGGSRLFPLNSGLHNVYQWLADLVFITDTFYLGAAVDAAWTLQLVQHAGLLYFGLLPQACPN